MNSSRFDSSSEIVFQRLEQELAVDAQLQFHFICWMIRTGAEESFSEDVLADTKRMTMRRRAIEFDWLVESRLVEAGFA